MKNGILIIGCMIIGLLAFTGSVEARYDYEVAYGYSGRDSESRNAVAMDDWLERGRAAVTESPVFSDGVRITAWGGAEAHEPGLASAIYYFTVPRGAQYLKISIRYNDAAQDDTIAGRLWIKSIVHDMRGEIGPGEEAPLYGDTFILRSERSSETIIVPASRHVEGGMVEMHVVVEGNDCIDVRDIQVAYLDTRPQITVVRRTYSDYWHQWPRHRYAYHYYYWGPLFWPRTYVVYECWDVPIRFYWVTWRPWFFVNIIRVHHHRPWWGPRRYTVVYHVNVKHPFHERSHLLRKRLKERHVHVTKVIRPKHVVTPPERTRLPLAREVRLTKEVKNPRTVETRVNPNSTQRPLKEQPERTKKGGKEIIRKAKKVTPAPISRPSTEQLAQEKKRPARLTVNKEAKTVKRSQVVSTPDSQPARPSPTAPPQRIHKEQPQPRAATQQPRSGSMDRGTARNKTSVRAAPNHSVRQEGTAQDHAKIGQGNRSQSRQEIRQPLPQTERQRRK